jgi:hypothetical protein
MCKMGSSCLPRHTDKTLAGVHGVLPLCTIFLLLCTGPAAMAQMGVSMPLSPAERQKAEAEQQARGTLPIPRAV